MKYGFIGLGNMAGAILQGMHLSGGFVNDEIYGFNRSAAKTLGFKDSVGLIPCADAKETAEKADLIVLAVKPQIMPTVLAEIAPVVTKEKTVLTIAAGKTLAWYEEKFGEGVPVVRIMPNINAKVKSSVTAICGGRYAEERHLAAARNVFSTVGRVFTIEEKMFSAFSAIGGASGAFVYMYIDALADAGVRAGFPRPFAVELASSAVLGSARLVLESGEHPAALQNQVCSPGGTTIEGVIKLKELGFESAVQQATQAVIDKDSKL